MSFCNCTPSSPSYSLQMYFRCWGSWCICMPTNNEYPQQSTHNTSLCTESSCRNMLWSQVIYWHQWWTYWRACSRCRMESTFEPLIFKSFWCVYIFKYNHNNLTKTHVQAMWCSLHPHPPLASHPHHSIHPTPYHHHCCQWTHPHRQKLIPQPYPIIECIPYQPHHQPQHQGNMGLHQNHSHQ